MKELPLEPGEGINCYTSSIEYLLDGYKSELAGATQRHRVSGDRKKKESGYDGLQAPCLCVFCPTHTEKAEVQ